MKQITKRRNNRAKKAVRKARKLQQKNEMLIKDITRITVERDLLKARFNKLFAMLKPLIRGQEIYINPASKWGAPNLVDKFTGMDNKAKVSFFDYLVTIGFIEVSEHCGRVNVHLKALAEMEELKL